MLKLVHILRNETLIVTRNPNLFLTAKNVALAGVRRLTIHDTQPATHWDLNTQYFISAKDLGANRAIVTAAKVSELNPYVAVDYNTTEFTKGLDFLREYTVCVNLFCVTQGDIKCLFVFTRLWF